MTPERFRELFLYEPSTGFLFWKKSTSCRGKVGAKAGCIQKKTGYISTSVDGRTITAHRVVWMMHFGPIDPDHHIDHINGNRADNRLENLRSVTRQINAQNRKGPASHNSTGYLGVGYRKHAKRFYAAIAAPDKTHHLGYFKTAEEAHAAYLAAKARLHVGNGACSLTPQQTTDHGEVCLEGEFA